MANLELGIYAALPTAYEITRSNYTGRSFTCRFMLVVTQSNIRAFKCFCCGWDSPAFPMQRTADPPSEILPHMIEHTEDHAGESIKRLSVSLTPTTEEIQ